MCRAIRRLVLFVQSNILRAGVFQTRNTDVLVAPPLLITINSTFLVMIDLTASLRQLCAVVERQ